MPKTPQSSRSPLPAEENSSHIIAGVAPLARRVAAGAYLFRHGDTSFGIFKLVAGQMTLVRVTPDGTNVPMHTAHSGEIFAEASLFSTTYHCDALALCDCEVLVYPKKDLFHQFAERPEDVLAFAAELAHRIQGLRTRLQIRQIRSARERVVSALKLKCGEKGVWKLDVTLKHFAEEIGLTHEALYRTLASLEKEGSIMRSKDWISMT
jgi:CRP-like cAMP-binding protein